jgi:hypothetical protein
MKKPAMLSVLLMAAGTAVASNTAFRLNYDIPYDVNRLNNVPVSLPYFYFPAGPGNAPRKSQLCLDAGSDLAAVARWNNTIDSWTQLPCGAADFEILPGVGYILLRSAPFTFNIVGSHDDTFRPGGSSVVTLDCMAGTLCNNWASIPYHCVAESVNDPSQTSPPFTALCQELNASTGGQIASIGRLDPSTDSFTIITCGGFGDFSIVPGEALNIVPSVTSVDIQIQTY